MKDDAVPEFDRAAELPLSEARVPLVPPQLLIWLEGANEVSRKLAAAEHDTVLPITVVRHPNYEGGDE